MLCLLLREGGFDRRFGVHGGLSFLARLGGLGHRFQGGGLRLSGSLLLGNLGHILCLLSLSLFALRFFSGLAGLLLSRLRLFLSRLRFFLRSLGLLLPFGGFLLCRLGRLLRCLCRLLRLLGRLRRPLGRLFLSPFGRFLRLGGLCLRRLRRLLRLLSLLARRLCRLPAIACSRAGSRCARGIACSPR